MEAEKEEHLCPNCRKIIDQKDVHIDRSFEDRAVPSHVHCRKCGQRSEFRGDENGVILIPTVQKSTEV